MVITNAIWINTETMLEIRKRGPLSQNESQQPETSLEIRDVNDVMVLKKWEMKNVDIQVCMWKKRGLSELIRGGTF